MPENFIQKNESVGTPEKPEIITGEEAVKLLSEKYEEMVEARRREFGFSAEQYDTPVINWGNFINLRAVKKSAHGSLLVNGLTFKPDILFIPKEASLEFKQSVERILNDSFFVHRISGFYYEDAPETLGSATKHIEEETFYAKGGFFACPTTCPWDMSLKGRGWLSLYFNSYLMSLMTPSEESMSALLDYYDGEEIPVLEMMRRLAYHSISTKQNDIVRIHSGSKGKYAGAEEGYPDLILQLLGNRGTDLSYYNNVLGLLFVAEVEKKDGNQVKLTPGSFNPDFAELIPDYETALRVNGHVKGEKIKKRLIMTPIQRVVPKIISGIIERDERGIVNRIAAPDREGRMIIYNQSFTEEVNL